MSFIGVDPDRMRELASLADAISAGASDVATRAATIISTHQLEDLAGNTTGLLDNVQNEMTNLSELAQTKAADIELAANGGIAAFCLPWPFPWNESKEDILDKIRGDVNNGGDDEMSVFELNAVRDRLKNLSEEDRAWVLGQLSDEELARLMNNVDSDRGRAPIKWGEDQRSEFYDLIDKLPPELQDRIRQQSPAYCKELEAEAATNNVSPETRAALEDLRNSEGYKRATSDEKIALMSQVVNYPNEKSIFNLERLASKQWARDFTLDDFQRSAKVVADLSQGSGNREILDNTLDAFLADDAPYRFDWNMTPPTSTNPAQAANGVFHFNRMYLAAGNGDVEHSIPPGRSLGEAQWMIRSGTPHEINHLRNGDRQSETFNYFMGEYRAFYVGVLAQTGKPPTRSAIASVLLQLVNPDPASPYAVLARALNDPAEGPRITAFLEEIFGGPVDPADLYQTAQGGAVDGDKSAPPPVSVDGGPNNTNNGP